jgi:hypothetical protein
VEFAIVGALFLLLLLAVIEFGRMVFVWNSVTEATRRGVRVAVVCPVNDPAIRNVTVFNDDTTAGPSALLGGLSTADVTVDYLDALGNPRTCTGCNCDDTCGDSPFASIRYVRVGISGYQYNLLLPPPLNVTLTLPPFESTLPRESLGVVPGVGVMCTFS